MNSAVENAFPTTTTGSFQNHSSSAAATGSVRPRKRGIAALLKDATNCPDTSHRNAGLQAKAAMTTATIRRARHTQGMQPKQRKTVTRPAACKSQQPPTLCRGNQCTITECIEYLMSYIQRNASYEIQKASAISIMGTAITAWGCSIEEAVTRAAACTGFASETIRKWASSFFSTCDVADDINDDFVEELLSSNRGYHDTSSLVHSEAFQLSARCFVQAHACRKGEPNMTSRMFADSVESEHNVRVHDETARRWLGELGFSQVHHQKGVYFDGHDRDDVVQYRNIFLATMDELDKKSLTVDNTTLQLDEGEKPLIRVVHDESTYYANADQTFFWGDEHTNVLKQKSLGAAIMVSDFIDEVGGFVRDGEDQARVLLETQWDGYFTNDLLLQQVTRTADIFERVHPDARGLFLFDNAPSHRKMADDTLNADRMNVGPGGKQPKMRDTVWQGAVQKMVDASGTPKGMKLILEERGVNTVGLRAKEMREMLKTHEDFMQQKCILEEYIQGRGHICMFYPKFHCELSPIERVWCQSKKHTRAYANGTITRLRTIVPEGLDRVTLEQIQKYFRTCRDYERAYRQGGTGKEVEERVKVYKSHRRVLNTDA